MNKVIFKKAQSFVDALRVKFDNTLGTALVYMVYTLCLQSEEPEDQLEKISAYANMRFANLLHYITRTLNDFDALFEAGHHHTEVYLGRDGIFPYLARRAQLWVRRKAGIAVPKVVYIVYNSKMRDQISEDQTVQYMSQFGINRDNVRKCLFYDTGYTGSIPEQILTRLGVDETEFDNRIRLTYYARDYRKNPEYRDEDDKNCRNIWLFFSSPEDIGFDKNLLFRDRLLRNNRLWDAECSCQNEDSAEAVLAVRRDGSLHHQAKTAYEPSRRLYKSCRVFLVAYFFQQEKKNLAHFRQVKKPSWRFFKANLKV